jgi:type I restriction enzyme, S subunit
MMLDKSLQDIWSLTEIGHVAQVIMGQAPIGTSYNEDGRGIPLIAGASDMGRDFPHPAKWTTSPTQICEPGDLIYCIRATIVVMNWADKKYCLGRGVAALRPIQELIDPYYLYYWLTINNANLL